MSQRGSSGCSAPDVRPDMAKRRVLEQCRLAKGGLLSFEVDSVPRVSIRTWSCTFSYSEAPSCPHIRMLTVWSSASEVAKENDSIAVDYSIVYPVVTMP